MKLKAFHKVLGLMAGVVMLGACAPGAYVQEGMRTMSYDIEIVNPTEHQLNVTLDAGAAQVTALGAIQPGETLRYRIQDPYVLDVEIVAVTPDQSMRIVERETLEAGAFNVVTLTP